MKKITSLVITIIISLIIILSINCNTFAGMADWDDKSADEAANKQLQEQKNEISETINKSTNNFLNRLKINGDTLKLDFDKQTLNYDIGETNSETIEIEAVPEDEKATINGNGKISLKSGENDIRIDVIAESGTTRTYHIKVTYRENNTTIGENIENVTESNTENNENGTLTSSNTESTKDATNKNNNFKVIIGFAIMLIFVIFIIRAIKGNRK